MKTKSIQLLPDPSNIKVTSTEKETVIFYNCPIWSTQTCIYVIPEKWELQEIIGNTVKLINHDETLMPLIHVLPYVN